MSRENSWKMAGLAAVLVAAVAALPAVRAAPEPAAKPQVATGQSAAAPLGRICKANEVVDSRPQPAWVGASFAGDNCRAPPMPKALDGYAATREQVVAAMAAAERYAAASDAYQKCIGDFLARRGRADAPLAIIENHRILVAQENKRTAARRVEVAINAFNEYGSECPDQ